MKDFVKNYEYFFISLDVTASHKQMVLYLCMHTVWIVVQFYFISCCYIITLLLRVLYQYTLLIVTYKICPATRTK